MALTRMIRRAWERLFGEWREGPEMPERFRHYALDYANRNPRATRAEFVQAMGDLADTAYRSGYVRGLEARERQGFSPSADPDEAAAQVDPEWRWTSPRLDLVEEAGPVVDGEEEARAMGRGGRVWPR